MYTRGQRLIIGASLGVGYFIYRGALKQTIFNSHTLPISNDSMKELRTNQYVMYEGQKALISHPVNKDKKRSKKRIVVVGGGLTGISTAYFLGQDPKIDVILIEREEDLADKAASAQNGCFMPSASYPLINFTTFKKFMGGFLFSSDWSVSLKSFVGEMYIGTWFLNALPNFMGFWVSERQSKLSELGRLSANALQDLNKHIELGSCDSDNDGTAVLHGKIIDAEEFKNNKNIDAILAPERFEPPLNDNIKGAVVFPQEYNLNSSKFAEALAAMAVDHGVIVFTGAEHLKFLRNKDTRKICGIITNAGVILCDEVVIAAGHETKTILNDLGLRVPLLGLKSYVIDFQASLLKTSLQYNLALEDMSATLSQLGDKCRLSGCFDIRGKNTQIEIKRIKFLIKKLDSILKGVELREEQPKAEIFSLTPDDVPILGPLPDQDNVYINTGHAKRGLATSLGASKLLAEAILDPKNQKVKDLLNGYSISRFSF